MDLLAEARSERARQAVLRRHHPDDPSVADESLRRLKGLRAETYIRGLLSTSPPLDLSERKRLAAILTGAMSAGGGDGHVAT